MVLTSISNSKNGRCQFSDGKMASLSITQTKFDCFKNIEIGDCLQFRCRVRVLANKKHKYLLIDKVLEVEPLNLPQWIYIEDQYGCVVRNRPNEKKITIYNPKYGLIKADKDEGMYAEEGETVKFKPVCKTSKKEIVFLATNFAPCDKEEALDVFESRFVAVNHIDDDAMAFYYASADPDIYGRISFKNTTLRPLPGDVYKIIYFDYKNGRSTKRVILDYYHIENEPDKKFTVRGHLTVNHKSNGKKKGKNTLPSFGFVNQKYFVPGMILRKVKITGDCFVATHLVQIGDKSVVFDIFPLGR